MRKAESIAFSARTCWDSNHWASTTAPDLTSRTAASRALHDSLRARCGYPWIAHPSGDQHVFRQAPPVV
jgi:hypothetical protein